MPHLIGNRIVLREYRWEDLPEIRTWVNDPEVTGYLSDVFLFPNTMHDTETFLRKMIEGTSEMKGFIIADKETLSYIGQIDLIKIDWKNRNAILGIVIGKKAYWGKGYGREAIQLLQGFVFDSLNLHRLELDVFAFNQRAIKCYLACGFKEEGRMRQKKFANGQYWDIIKMGILKSEYEEMVGK